MPADYRIDPQRRMVLSRAWGALTAADLAAHRRRLEKDPRFDPAFRQVFDLSEVDRVEISSSEVKELVRKDPWGPESRRAVVAPTDLVYGMARMYEMLRDESPSEFAVFRSSSEAERWLRDDH